MGPNNGFGAFSSSKLNLFKAGVIAAAGVLSRSYLMSHSLAWKDWEPASVSEDAVPWGEGNTPSLEDATPGPSVSIPGAVL